jgi:hypothetical protein
MNNMSRTDIRGLGESPAQAKKPHSIWFNGRKHGTYPNYKAAYFAGCTKWGSGSLCTTIFDAPDGWRIVREELKED